ncbi:MAG: acetyl-CoA C-acyltransferase [Acidimicrobiales bacterium]
MTSSAWVVDAVRTPIGRIGGALSRVRPDDLAATTIRSLLSRHPSLDPALIDDVVLGDANGAGEDNRDVARMAVLLAGLPVTVPGSTVNRLCASGMESVVQVSRALEVSDAHVALAGGVESMSRAPWILPKNEEVLPRGDAKLFSSTLGWRMVNPAMPAEWTVPLGEGAEILAERYDLSRDAQDVFAYESHVKAAAAWREGTFNDEVVQVTDCVLERDESIRDTTPEQLASLRPVFREGGTVTAGNSSPMNDGASMLLMVDDEGLSRWGSGALARVAGRGVSAVEPQLYGLGPVEAARQALRRAGIGWSDIAVIELNEAFASQSLACLREWPELDPTIVNPLGGAIALGHPLGCSGARLLTTLAWQLHRRGGGYGLAAMCVGVGQGVAIVLEAV